MAQEGATAPSLLGRSSEGLSCRACDSKGKKRGGGQSKERS